MKTPLFLPVPVAIVYALALLATMTCATLAEGTLRTTLYLGASVLVIAFGLFGLNKTYADLFVPKWLRTHHPALPCLFWAQTFFAMITAWICIRSL
jgi:hypothetical protein